MGDVSLHTPSRIYELTEKDIEQPALRLWGNKMLENPARDHDCTKVEHDQ